MSKTKLFSGIIFLLSLPLTAFPQFSVSLEGTLLEKVSNNAVSEGFINSEPQLFSFGGIDSTKIYSGIHLRSFRFDINSNTCTQIPDLPDTLGKIAAAANRIGDTIYISGGYHVLSNGNELSSNKMHRYHIGSNSYLNNAPDIPIPTDDHVQVVWRDSLIVLISGWSNNGNISAVQIYNPYSNTWSVGTDIPNNNIYKSFGASGSIIADTIYYFGGASSGSGFNAQSQLRKGIINPQNPTDITWSNSVPNNTTKGYRSAACAIDSWLLWIGGSNITYNYNGIAYNGSGGVPTNNRILYKNVNDLTWEERYSVEIPMDLRGLANIGPYTKYIAGGMINAQESTNKIYKITADSSSLSDSFTDPYVQTFKFFPNPTKQAITISLNSAEAFYFRLLRIDGILVISKFLDGFENIVNLEGLSAGFYLVQIHQNGKTLTETLIKQ